MTENAPQNSDDPRLGLARAALSFLERASNAKLVILLCAAGLAFGTYKLNFMGAALDELRGLSMKTSDVDHHVGEVGRGLYYVKKELAQLRAETKEGNDIQTENGKLLAEINGTLRVVAGALMSANKMGSPAAYKTISQEKNP